MIIEATHGFRAVHAHTIPPGVMSEPHPHDWVWTVWLDGPPHPVYRWVANFDDVRAMMATCVGEHYEATTEQINAWLAHELAWKLGPHGPVIIRSRLQEKDGQAAWFDPSKDGGAFGPTLEDGRP